MRAELRHNLNQSAFSKFSVLVAVGLVVVLSIFAFGIFYLSRVTASDAEGAYWADSSKVSVTPAGYATNATGQLSAILAITNSGPYTFAYDGHIETFNGKHWVDFPSGNLYVYTPATSLLNPGSSATLLVPAPSPNIKWRAKLDVRDVHGKGPVAWLTRVWEDCVKKDHKMGCVYSEE